jgi:hypothetical protein
MVCSRQARVLARSCSLIAVAVLASVMTSEASVTTDADASPVQKGTRKHIQRRHQITPSLPESAPLPIPIPRMTMDELPTQTPRVIYSLGVLTLDSENTTLTEALSAIRDETSMQIESLPQSNERFSAHYSGTPREVIAHLLEGSEFGYVLVAFPDDPAKLDKLILTKLAPPTPSVTFRTGTANSPRPSPSRLAPSIPPESAAERPDEAVLDAKSKALPGDETTQKLPAPLSLMATRPVDAPAPTAPPDDSSPANATLLQPAGADSKKQVNATGQYMQDLYRMRLQLQGQQSGTDAATSPQ